MRVGAEDLEVPVPDAAAVEHRWRRRDAHVRIRRVTGAAVELDPGAHVLRDATEEAVYNSLLKATTTTGNGRTVQALPIDKLQELLKKYGR